MNRFLLYEPVEDSKAKIMAEGIKFSNGKCCISILGNVDCVQLYDNIDKMSSLLCNENVKLFILPEKKEESENKD